MNSIKAIIFDLDGVLVNTRELHYETFKKAYEHTCPSHTLTWKEHNMIYDGLSTRQKLEKMILLQKISKEESEFVYIEKQKATLDILPNIVSPRPALIRLLVTLKQKGYILVCASNSVRETLDLTLKCLGIYDFFTFTLSNNDVIHPKPSPEIYTLCFNKLNLLPHECLICEDSPHGQKSATLSGGHLLEIIDAEDLTLQKIINKINTLNTPSSIESKTKQIIQVVIPMAGEGSRFKNAGYTIPKPFIDVFGKPMIQWVIENVYSNDLSLEFIFICRKSHIEEYDADKLFTSMNINYKIVPVDSLTEGAVCTVLLAKHLLSLNTPLMIVNSDQYLEWDVNIFYKCLLNPFYDGVISTFYSPDKTDTKWSFAKVDDNLCVSEVAEKVWIGPNATTGIYGWKRSSDFIKYAENMISKNIRVNNEFYICPVYNEAIKDSGKIRTLNCKKMWGLGVPDDLYIFLRNYNK